MGIFIGWVVISLVVGAIASDRTVGFWGGFLLSLLLSPLIGIIVVLFSKSNEPVIINPVIVQPEVKKDSKPVTSVADELQKLKNLQENGVINQEEFDAQKAKLLS